MPGKKILIDEYKEPLKLVESYNTSKNGAYTGAVLATLFGTLSDYGHETRNDRWYTGSLWKKVLNDPLFQEALRTKTSFGEADHPLDVENRLETHIPYVSHIIREPRINEGKQVVEGYLDILDTPNGRIIKTLLDYGCILGVSSRGSGDLISVDGKVVVDENTYTFVTWDIVARPSNQMARVHEIDTVDQNGKTAFESLKEQVNTMINNKDSNNLKLVETLITKSEIPDRDNIINIIHESLESKSNTDNTVVDKNDLDQAYQRILDLKSENADLVTKNKSLIKSNEELENTISDLEGFNKNLTSMVSSYREELSNKGNSPKEHTMIGTNSDEDNKFNEDDLVKKDDLNKIEDSIKDLKVFNKSVLEKLSGILTKLNESDKIDDLECNNQKVTSELKSAKSKISELESSLDSIKTENLVLVKKASNAINEYFKLRCLQLGLNEKIARKEFNGKLYEYDLSDIEDALSELYANDNNSNKRINESVSYNKRLGSLQLTGSVKSKVVDDKPKENNDGLVESIRQVRHS